MNFYSVISDLILAVHFAFVSFIVAGLVVIWIGCLRRWRLIHNFRFRVAHLLAMGFVLFESIVGIVCPLTAWEDKLRLRAGEGLTYEGSFIQRWLGRVLFFDASERVFTAIYAGFFVLMVLTFWVVPPSRSKHGRQSGST